MQLRWLPLLPAMVLTTSFLPSTPARACGGTFCDSGPTAMPVDQTGENILFVPDGESVEAHIQIQYEGEAERFAWVIPVPSVPEFRVGSQLLFQELLRASVPRYGLQQMPDSCADESLQRGPFPVPVASGGASSSSGGDGGGPQVVLRQTVGAFDVTVLEGGTAEEVSEWLTNNNYAQIPGATALLQQYVDENSLFAAVKLTGGAGVDEIHPLVLRYAVGIPCVPLRLTAVAATSNMGVRTFFLGQSRVVPRTYRHVEVNPLRIDWLNNGANYSEVVANAADDPASGGHGFVTEYAGPSTVLLEAVFNDPRWSADALPSTPAEVVAELHAQAIMSCNRPALGDGPRTCQFFHPLVRGILQSYLPAPADMEEFVFWGDLEAHAALINEEAWDPVAFASDYRTRVVEPARRAGELVRNNSYLTRLMTFISPDEMTVDPEFHERADLGDVAATRIATLRTRCDDSQVLILPDGREIELDDNGRQPSFGAEMPWAETVQDIPETGPITTLADRSGDIDTQVAAWNSSRRPDSPAVCLCASTPSAGVAWGGIMAVLALLASGRRRR